MHVEGMCMHLKQAKSWPLCQTSASLTWKPDRTLAIVQGCSSAGTMWEGDCRKKRVVGRLMRRMDGTCHRRIRVLKSARGPSLSPNHWFSSPLIPVASPSLYSPLHVLSCSLFIPCSFLSVFFLFLSIQPKWATPCMFGLLDWVGNLPWQIYTPTFIQYEKNDTAFWRGSLWVFGTDTDPRRLLVEFLRGPGPRNPHYGYAYTPYGTCAEKNEWPTSASMATDEWWEWWWRGTTALQRRVFIFRPVMMPCTCILAAEIDIVQSDHSTHRPGNCVSHFSASQHE